MDLKAGSKTAWGAASLRVAHQLIDGPSTLLHDPVILSLMGPEMQDYILMHPEKYHSPGARSLRTHIVLRSRFTEDCLEKAFYQGVRHYLILGAGLDTFAYRQPAWTDGIAGAGGLRITEVDHPASQETKRHLLERAGIPLPHNLSFVSSDFEKDDLVSSLEGMHDKTDLLRPVFLSCLGVLVYLTREAVLKLFRFAASFAPGSEFVFTISGKDAAYTAAARRAAAVGEPWLTHFDPVELEDTLRNLGFRSVEFLTPSLATKNYFQTGQLQLPPPERTSVVHAIL